MIRTLEKIGPCLSIGLLFNLKGAVVDEHTTYVNEVRFNTPE
jgi:hypothetical protein